MGIISLDPDPYKKNLDPESGSVSNYTDSPHCCQLFVRVGHCVLLRSARNVLKRNVFFSIFLRKVCKVRNILLGFISCKKFEKRTLKFFDRVKKNARSFKKNQHSLCVLLKRTRVLFNRTCVLFKRTRVLFKRTRVLFNRTRVILKRTRVLFKGTCVLFKTTAGFF